MLPHAKLPPELPLPLPLPKCDDTEAQNCEDEMARIAHKTGDGNRIIVFLKVIPFRATSRGTIAAVIVGRILERAVAMT